MNGYNRIKKIINCIRSVEMRMLVKGKEKYWKFWEEEKIGEQVRQLNEIGAIYEDEPQSEFQCKFRLQQIANLEQEFEDAREFVIRLVKEENQDVRTQCANNEDPFSFVANFLNTLLGNSAEPSNSAMVFFDTSLIYGYIYKCKTELEDILQTIATHPEQAPTPEPSTESEQNTETPTPAHNEQVTTIELNTGAAHVTQWLIDNFGKEQAEAFICAVNALSRTNKGQKKVKGLKKVIAERFAEMKYIDDGYVKLYGQKLAEELNNCVGDFLKACNTKEYTRADVGKYNKNGLFVNMDFYE